jgi:thioredoxin-like negative regulator of GroEL
VGSEVARFVSVRYDGDSPVGKSVAQRFGVRGFPSVVIVDGSGRKLDEFSGFREAPQFIQRLRASAPR